ncbi:ABC transporter permease [Lachnospiraceae bacterium WCA-693-APC-MOT-I]|uniref:ABC transporter permease n=1 Tax=Velocimicrobium porci TaxID=2606634 RepID=A0A6L5Y323_9FIRM|nr:ABC transporter permease [Velocimicrobium porci]MSS64523.1 ABC transporter permease [Velocimicrobium porci]
MSPIDPLKTNVGQTALGSMSEQQIQKVKEYWGVDKPPLKRYFAWAKEALKGNMGISLLYRQDVTKIIWEKLKNSIILMGTAWILSGLFGVALGVLAAVKRETWVDKIIKSYCFLIASTPGFWMGILLIIIFSVWLNWFPIGLSVPIGMDMAEVTILDRIRHAVLPTVTLSVLGVANIALHTREKMIDVMQSDYVLFARARGESDWEIIKWHGLRNILLPVITLQFASISEIVGGTVLIEQTFSYPGLGQAAVIAGLGSDMPLLMGITIVSASLVFVGNFIANVLYHVIDPRIR